MRAWATLSQGQMTAATADLALTQVDVRLAKDLQPIAMQSVSGRFAGQTSRAVFGLLPKVWLFAPKTVSSGPAVM